VSENAKTSKDRHVASLIDSLNQFKDAPLNGLVNDNYTKIFAEQIVDSIRRIEYMATIGKRDISVDRLNPLSKEFDPLKAALYYKRNDNVDEAFWLVFLATHFGKSEKSGWLLCADIYGALGEREPWTWQNITSNFDEFIAWYRNASNTLINDSIVRRFSNHRKYESLRNNANRSIPRVFGSYVNWIGGHNSHIAKLEESKQTVMNDNEKLFDLLYTSACKNLVSFSRLAVFDLLTMQSKMGLIVTYPQKAYLKGSTGPILGTNLLFFNTLTKSNPNFLEGYLSDLAAHLNLGVFAMQILEDSICNWQKSPCRYRHFKG
jgi:hypothetical protein